MQGNNQFSSKQILFVVHSKIAVEGNYMNGTLKIKDDTKGSRNG